MIIQIKNKIKPIGRRESFCPGSGAADDGVLAMLKAAASTECSGGRGAASSLLSSCSLMCKVLSAGPASVIIQVQFYTSRHSASSNIAGLQEGVVCTLTQLEHD